MRLMMLVLMLAGAVWGSYSDTVLSIDSCVAYFQSDTGADSSIITDYSPTGFDATNHKSTLISSMLPPGRNFVAVDSQYYQAGRMAEIEGDSTLSIAFMVRFDTLAGNGDIFLKNISSITDFIGIRVYQLNSGSNYEMYFSPKTYTTSGRLTITGNFTAGIWYHFVWTYNAKGAAAASRIVCWVDGVRKSLTYFGTATMPTATDTSHVRIGGSPTRATVKGGFFDGDIDELAVWDIALDSTQVQSLFTNVPTDTGRLAIEFVKDADAHRIYQRDYGVPLRAIVDTNNVTKVTAVVYKGGDVSIASATFDSVFTGDTCFGVIDIPIGYNYSIALSARNSSDSILKTITSASFSVGSVWAIMGQSNACGNITGSYTTAVDQSGNYNFVSRAWQKCTDPIAYSPEFTTVGATMAPSIANTVWARDSVPIGFVNLGVGSTPLVSVGDTMSWGYRRDANHFDTTTIYGRAVNYIRAATDTGKMEGVIWLQGEAEALANKSILSYTDSFAIVKNRIAEDLQSGYKWIVIPIGQYLGGLSTDSAFNNIRRALGSLDTIDDVYVAPQTVDLYPKDTLIHFGKLGQDTIGYRVADIVSNILTGRAIPQKPNILYVNKFHTDSVDVIISADAGINADSTVGILSVYSDGSWADPTSIVVHGDTLRIGAAAAIDSVRHIYGKKLTQIHSLVRDSSTNRLSLEPYYATTPTWYPPTIDSIRPASVRRDSLFTVYGSNFEASQGAGKLKLNSLDLGPALVWSVDSIVDTVPSSAPRGYYNDSLFTNGGLSTYLHFGTRVLVPAISGGE